MSREDIEKRIAKEKQKISELQGQIDRSNAFIQGLYEALKLSIIPKSGARSESSPQDISYFRSGDTKSAYELLKQSDKPLHINDILTAIGKPINKQNRASLASSLHRAAKRTGIVKSVGNNTFTTTQGNSETKEELIHLPDDFGQDEETPKDLPFK